MLPSIWRFLFEGKSAMWTAIFTAVLSLLAVLTYNVGKISSESARATDRAFLNFSGSGLGVRLNDPSGAWAGYEVNLLWNNSGNTPTRWAVIQANGQIWPGDLPKGFDFPLAADKTITVIGPKANYGTSLTIPRNLWVENWHGRNRLFLWGTVLYRDIFPKTPDRLTEFCAEIFHVTTAPTPLSIAPQPPVVLRPNSAPTQPTSPQTTDIESPRNVIGGFSWKVCLEHSCYDEDCKDYKARGKDMQPF
jgi:hypothetical protein